MNTKQLTKKHLGEVREQFRDVALEGWESGRTDFLAGRAPCFRKPMTYFEKAYCFGYTELALNENWEQYRAIAKDGFEKGESDYHAGRELFFDEPETYYEKGYLIGYKTAQRWHQRPENGHPAI